MAEVIHDAELITSLEKVGGRFPWEEWMDGNTRRALPGADFPEDAEKFKKTLINRGRATRHNVYLKIQDDGSVLFRFEKRADPSAADDA